MPRRIELIAPLARHEEARAAGVIKPGHVIKVDADGNVVVHATAAGPGEFLIAKEDALQGRTIDDAYAVDELVFYAIPLPGEVVMGRVAASATAVVLGNPVTSNGDGCFRLWTTGTIWGYAQESVDNSAGVAEAFIKVRRA